MSSDQINEPKTGLKGWTTRDLMVMAAIAIVLGLLLAGVNYVSAALLAINPVFVAVLAGVYFLPGIMVMLIIRRPGAVVLTRVVINLIMIPFTPFGWMELVVNIIFGLASELPFTLTRYRDYRLRIPLLSGISAGLLSFVMMFAFAALSDLTPFLQIIAAFLFPISGALLGGWLAHALANSIAKTGVLNNYAIGQERMEDI